MTVPIINLAQWYASPAGQHLRQWEQARCDQAVGDCFGYHALQIGSEHLPLLRNSRIQQRWVAGIDFIRVDKATLAVTLGLGVIAMLFFSWLPAVQASRAAVSDTLRQGGRTMAGSGTFGA